MIRRLIIMYAVFTTVLFFSEEAMAQKMPVGEKNGDFIALNNTDTLWLSFGILSEVISSVWVDYYEREERPVIILLPADEIKGMIIVDGVTGSDSVRDEDPFMP